MSKKKSCKFKVGDPVTSIRFGHGVVESIITIKNVTYPIKVTFNGRVESYTKDGKYLNYAFSYDLVKGHVKAIKLVGIKDKNVSENKD